MRVSSKTLHLDICMGIQGQLQLHLDHALQVPIPPPASTCLLSASRQRTPGTAMVVALDMVQPLGTGAPRVTPALMAIVPVLHRPRRAGRGPLLAPARFPHPHEHLRRCPPIPGSHRALTHAPPPRVLVRIRERILTPGPQPAPIPTPIPSPRWILGRSPHRLHHHFVVHKVLLALRLRPFAIS